ncbi:type III effector HrpK domain-containing protein [Pokkaliibacter sp. MBI-7]|uniref:type III effector HrpK domain-containing protein n=1 Tax=Pokkaliibacter sp. MBI-7 TaxID=3040600 RepID=UPI0024499296|nr:type III effector HrpK domain-containing protein [Pokkaliibacter sp. MBI-7]MDH2431369.1 type III effector HrpK domain-containing protein [Pokkaliibacter sp. MBI-7]
MRVGSGSIQVQITLTDGPEPQASLAPPTPSRGQGVSFGTTKNTATSSSSSSTAASCNQPSLPDSDLTASSLFSAIAALFNGHTSSPQTVNQQNPVGPQPGVTDPAAPAATAPAAAPTAAPSPTAAVTDSKTDPAVLASIDNSRFSSPEQLKKWDSMVSHLPPEQREAAAKELNRPYAAARMAAGKGKEAEEGMAYLMANPALATAIDTGGKDGKADGKITKKDLKSFAKIMDKQLKGADEMMKDYMKAHPDADPQSLSMVRSAAMMYANDAVLRGAADYKKVGANNQQDTHYSATADFEALANPANNPDLSPQLAEAARLWSKPGMLSILEDAGLKGKDVARHGGDGLVAKGDFKAFVEKLAPKNGAEFSDFMAYAAMLNAAAKVDISKLDGDVFEHPDQYSGAAKAAVLMKLQKTQQYVVAGRDIRDTDETEKDMQAKIDQLQSDADVQRFMETQVKANKQEIINSSPELARNVGQYMQSDVLTGNSLRKSLDQLGANPSAGQVSNALEDFRGEVQQYQDLTGKTLDVADIVASRPDLARTLQQADKSVMDGSALTEQLKQKGATTESALDGYWSSVAFIDDALSKSPGGGGRMPSAETVTNALRSAGVDTSKLAAIKDATLQALLKKGDNPMLDLLDHSRSGGNRLLNEVKEKAIKTAAKQAAKQGAKFATQLVANIAGRAIGQAAGMAVASTISAAAGPIGWAAGAAVSLGFGIAELVDFFKGKAKKRRERRDFDRTVSPTLDQFGIAKPK